MYEHRRLLLQIKSVFNSFDNFFHYFFDNTEWKNNRKYIFLYLRGSKDFGMGGKEKYGRGSRNWKESHFLFVKQRGLSATLFFRDAPATFSFSSLFLPVLKKVWFACKEIRMRGDGENEYFMKYFEVLNEV